MGPLEPVQRTDLYDVHYTHLIRRPSGRTFMIDMVVAEISGCLETGFSSSSPRSRTHRVFILRRGFAPRITGNRGAVFSLPSDRRRYPLEALRPLFLE